MSHAVRLVAFLQIFSCIADYLSWKHFFPPLEKKIRKLFFSTSSLHLIQSFEYKLTYIWIPDSHLLSVGAPPHPPGGACTLAKSHPSHSLLLCSCAADVGLSTSIHLLGTWTNYELEGELNSLVPFSYSLGKFGIVTGSNHTTGASNTWETRSLQNFMLPMIDSNTT